MGLLSDFSKFVEQHVAKVAPVEKALALAYWKATTTGDKDAYGRVSELEIELRKLHADPKHFDFLKRVAAKADGLDARDRRQLILLKNAFEENQIDSELMKGMVELSTEVQKTFSEFRGKIGEKEVSDNEIKTILRKEEDVELRKAAWLAYKAKGAVVRDQVLELVRLRNKAAAKLGYPDFYSMRLRLMEQDPDQIQKMFDELAEQTDAPFAEIMKEVRAELAKRHGVAADALMPWHFEDPFFQEAPTLRGVDLDPMFAASDPVKLVQGFFRGVGLDPADILDHSDLYEKQGKMPHAYCTHIDRSGDVRILANLQNNEQWTSTLMHEMGHAVYDRYLDMELPWLLRSPSHSFATEAIAMLFGRQTRNPAWLKDVVGVDPAKLEPISADLKFSLRLSMLVFARWAMVMASFERQMYANPEQDLNKLWWTLKSRYQGIAPPPGRDAPDWASKIHVAVWPAYYHNYLLGEMMASQLLSVIAVKLLGGGDANQLQLKDKAEVGTWLKAKVFAPGASLRWDELLIKATGETLNPKYFAQQFLE